MHSIIVCGYKKLMIESSVVLEADDLISSGTVEFGERKNGDSSRLALTLFARLTACRVAHMHQSSFSLTSLSQAWHTRRRAAMCT